MWSCGESLASRRRCALVHAFKISSIAIAAAGLRSFAPLMK
jgi:hypothetical protein